MIRASNNPFSCDPMLKGGSFKGYWNADTNTPALVNGVGQASDYLITSVPGENFSYTFAERDRVEYNGSIWYKSVDNNQATDISGKQDTLTDVNFGSFINGLTSKTTPVDADQIGLMDSADSNKQKKLSIANFKAYLDTFYLTLITSQTISGVKTFLSGTLGLRNVANTFTSFFTNTNTASRTYTLQNRNGVLADDTDLAGKMNIPSGTTNYVSKFLSATTIGLSRLFDDGSFFGIGTANIPTKDVTLGNQANRDIGIESSNNTTVGRDLSISAGKTVQYNSNLNFNPLSQTVRSWYGVTVAPNGNVYAGTSNGSIYMQTAGAGTFNDLSQTNRQWRGLAADASNNIYAVVNGGDIYLQTSGSGNFNALSQTSRAWVGVAVAPNGDVYAIVSGGDIYKRTGGTGNFNALSQTSRSWTGIAVAPNGNVYATVLNGDIYMQTAGSGNFNALSQTSRDWFGISTDVSGNVFAVVGAGDIYMQTAGTGNFNALSQTSRNWRSTSSDSTGNIYATVGNGDIYRADNAGTGTADLNGGTLKLKGGTGKGTGGSKVQIITGQKLSSGTNTHTETVRAEFDENGRATFFGVIKLNGYTVGTLPTGSVGDTAYVTDASSPTFLSTVAGGGSVKCRVFYDGTNWIVN